jgi:hypothetical protein
MKKVLLTLMISTALVIMTISISFSDSTGKLGHAGAPNENTCSESACHGSGQGGLADNAGPGSISITCSNMPGWVYTPGQVYHLTVTVTQSSCTLFGFSADAVNNGNGNAGNMVVTDNVHTRQGTPYAATKIYITHTGLSSPSPGTATTTNPAVFNYDWTAPASNVGPIRIYFDGLAANNNQMEDAGDNVYSGMQTITPASAVSTPTVMTTLNPGSGFPFYLRTTTGTPSVPQNFDVAGLALTGNMTISVPSPFQISTSPTSGFSVSPINLGPIAGSVAATKIYIRYNPTLSGSTTATITVSSTGATSQLGYANGTIASPVISAPSVSSLTTFNTIVGTPSSIDSFTISSSALVDNLVISAPVQFQISDHRYTAYVSSLTAPIFIPTWGYSGMKIYVRYNPAVGGTHSGNVTVSSTGATTRSVAVMGISSALGVSEKWSEKNISVYPNPAKESAKLSFNLENMQNMLITLKNIEGKEIATVANRSFDKGKNEVNIDCNGLSKGLYFISVQSNGICIYKKLIIE